jgi:hypothetical protein
VGDSCSVFVDRGGQFVEVGLHSFVCSVCVCMCVCVFVRMHCQRVSIC